MNLGHATFFIRITIVCGESASSASKLRSKQYPVKISSRKKQTIRSQTSGTAVDALNNGPSIKHVFELDDEESFPKLRKPTAIWRARSRDESTMTDVSIRERRTSRRRVEEVQKLTDRRKAHIQWFAGIRRAVRRRTLLTPAEWRSVEDQRGICEPGSAEDVRSRVLSTTW